ncbi:GspH/FimT family pseudopilin [Aliikangiella maris]|uniref:GspH/FimT family pseudopilin n=2 Tax=Aliikangiella maris TaxID=3162458 RepID=A0ABV2BNS5_9GAMM
MNKIRGFTLFELLMALLVIGVLTSFALPSFRSTIARTQVNTDKDALKGALNFARMEAIDKRIQTAFESNGSGGWQVRNVATDEVLRTFNISGVNSSIVTVKNPIIYEPSGYRQFGGAAVVFNICNDKGNGKESGKRVTVSTGGSLKTENIQC